MITFTITCPPTVAEASLETNSSLTSSYTNTEFINQGAAEGLAGTTTRQFSFGITTDFLSNVITSNSYFENFEGFGPDCDDDVFGGPYVGIASFQSGFSNITQSWNGARTVSTRGEITPQCEEGGIMEGATVWTSSGDLSEQTTTTWTTTSYNTTQLSITETTTVSGTTVESGATTHLTTTGTTTLVATTATAEYSTARRVTTTQPDNFAVWQSATDGDTHRGQFHVATVVCLETSNFGELRPEAAWIVTSRPNFTETSDSIAAEQSASQFTVFPSFSTLPGLVLQGFQTTTHPEEEEENEENTFTSISFATSSDVLTTATTYRTTTSTLADPFFVASAFTSIPSPLQEIVGATTITTQVWLSTISQSVYLGGDTSRTTVFSTTTHEARIEETTWNSTHRITTEVTTLLPYQTAYSFAASTSGTDNEGYTFTIGYSETRTATFRRPINIHAVITAPIDLQNQCGASFSWGVAAPSNITAIARQVDAGGASANFPVLVRGAQTAQAPLGSWSYETQETTISASAGARGLSVTSKYLEEESVITESTEGEWNINGDPATRADLPIDQRINIGGKPPKGDATAFYQAGIFSTSVAGGSGTLSVNSARTEIVDQTAQRTAYLPATGVFISAPGNETSAQPSINGLGQRYSTTFRNIYEVIPETAIISKRGQLIL